jgi:predicted DNA-binding antitoxin AbrB/MazE fold protein
MTKQVDAVYENGILRPLEPLPLEEHQRVTVTISDITGDPLASMIDGECQDWARKVVAETTHIPSLEEVQRMTAGDQSSWADVIIAERGARF